MNLFLHFLFFFLPSGPAKEVPQPPQQPPIEHWVDRPQDLGNYQE